MELQAALQCLHLSSPEPLRAARFYCSAYGMALETLADGFQCSGPARRVQVSSGPANQLKFAHFVLSSHSAWDTFAARVSGLDQQEPPAAFARQDSAIAVQDPDGNRVVFTPPAPPGSVISASAVNPAPALPPATLQHFALRTAQLPAMPHAQFVGQGDFAQLTGYRTHDFSAFRC